MTVLGGLSMNREGIEISSDCGISNYSGQIVSSEPQLFRKSLDLVITQNLHLFKSLRGWGGVLQEGNQHGGF